MQALTFFFAFVAVLAIIGLIVWPVQPMRRIITATLGLVLELSSVGFLIGATVLGWQLGGQFGIGQDHEVLSAALGFVVGLVAASLVFGVVFVLLDIDESSRETAKNTTALVDRVTALDNRLYEISTLISGMDRKVGQLENLQLQASSARAVADAVANKASPPAPL
jgi:hypothetical protein